MCILSVHTLLKVVVYCDFTVLSMSVMGFQKNKLWMGGGWSELLPSFFDFFNFAKPLIVNEKLTLNNKLDIDGNLFLCCI